MALLKIFVKILGLVLLISFGLYSAFVFIIEQVTDEKRGTGVALSIDEAIQENSLIAIYRIETMGDSTRRHFSTYGVNQILDSSQFWLTKSVGYTSEYLYFNKKMFSKENYLVFTNPVKSLQEDDSSLSIKITQGEFPVFGAFGSKNFVLMSINNESNQQVKIRFGKTLEDEIEYDFLPKIEIIEIGDSIPE